MKDLHRHNKRLQRVLRFNAADLDANRNGQFSRRQRGQIKRARLNELLIFILICLVFTAFVLFSLLRDFSWELLLASALMGVAGVVFGYEMTKRMRRFANDLDWGEVYQIEGTVKVEHLGGGSDDPDEFYLYVGGEKFKVSRRIYRAFKSKKGLRCRVFYTPNTRRVVAAEMIA
ncbi:MAG: hypothetical protein SF029_06610 [bacterium]|nr:hypothetical protein [bacterium]